MGDPQLGTVDRVFFAESIAPHLGADRDDVTLAPRHGVDFGMVDVGGQALALATDPILLLPRLGFERAALLAFHRLCSGVALTGLDPAYLSVDFNLPPEITDEQFRTVWETFDEEARKLGVAVVTGHTARYAGCSYPMVGGATTMAVGDHDALVRPDGARVGDRVVVTKGPAIGATALLSIQFESLLDSELDPDTIADAKDRFDDVSPIQDALTVAEAGGVTAMHDATEGGVYGGLFEMARAADVRIEIERDRIPVQPGVLEICEFFDIDPGISSSEGTLLVTVDPDDVGGVLDALDAAGIPAADVGEVVEGSGLVVDGEAVDHPGQDPFWATFEEHMAILQHESD